ncbi:hypothetical protein [Lacrimispora sp. 38-1]|uniref:hypothetical protein n=1 Tax=Lacrimispora sp. 38-1 TaxID=3125778 RepID=UPI003CEE5161
MPDYKEMYLTMMKAANKALKLNQEAIEHIIYAQQKAENMYIEADETPLSILPSTPGEQKSCTDRLLFAYFGSTWPEVVFSRKGGNAHGNHPPYDPSHWKRHDYYGNPKGRF